MSDVAEFGRVHAVPAANGSTLSWDAGTCSRVDVPQHEFCGVQLQSKIA